MFNELQNLLPSTKEFREVFREAQKLNNILILDSKTRDFKGSFYNLCDYVNASHSISFNERRIIRSVTFVVEALREDLDKCLDHVDVLLTLKDRRLHRIIRKDYYRTNKWNITYTCVIS